MSLLQSQWYSIQPRWCARILWPELSGAGASADAFKYQNLKLVPGWYFLFRLFLSSSNRSGQAQDECYWQQKFVSILHFSTHIVFLRFASLAYQSIDQDIYFVHAFDGVWHILDVSEFIATVHFIHLGTGLDQADQVCRIDLGI